MPDTGERHEITRRVNAKQAETVRQSKKLLSRSKQRSDDETSSRMHDEGCPNETTRTIPDATGYPDKDSSVPNNKYSITHPKMDDGV